MISPDARGEGAPSPIALEAPLLLREAIEKLMASLYFMYKLLYWLAACDDHLNT